ncbi:hypothetical protein M3Y94_00164000 [Aphelenchoides besseyi]|nr:hypothetical protein M3Y94_00164000 [Aphelenchoides besseyi]KAI6237041.1 Dilute domain-containing protein [Aphelenchoides besseyi]
MIDDLDFELSNGGVDFSSNTTNSTTFTATTKPSSDFYQLAFETNDFPSESSNSNDEIRTSESLEQKLSQVSLKRPSNVSRTSLRAYSISSSDVHSDEGTGSFLSGQLGLIEVLNISEFARLMVKDLRPRIARQLSHCQPAFIIFAAFRFGDHVQDDSLITELFNSIHTFLKDIAATSRDMDTLSMWLVYLYRLLNLFSQYDGKFEEEGWHFMNTEKQNSWRLKNFNFEPIRNQLKLRVEDFFQSLMKRVIEPLLTPKISAAILQHESDAPQMETKKITDDSKSRNLTRESSKESVVQSLDDMKEFLNVVHTKLRNFGADDVVLSQVFRQISQWICSLAMNQLVFRKDLCNFEKAIQIKHNVTEIENWFNKHELGFCSEALEPLIQASHLMQSRKDESNLDALSGDLTSKLTAKQVVAILQHYTPPPNFEEEEISSEFVNKLKDRLSERAALAEVNNSSQSLDSAIMPGTYLTKFNSQPFVYSDFVLEDLTVPSVLGLDSIIRLI